jgi:hypothetical protein
MLSEEPKYTLPTFMTTRRPFSVKTRGANSDALYASRLYLPLSPSPSQKRAWESQTWSSEQTKRRPVVDLHETEVMCQANKNMSRTIGTFEEVGHKVCLSGVVYRSDWEVELVRQLNRGKM